MACTTCSTCDHIQEEIHTMGTVVRWFWCPRCGTIMEKYPTAGGDESEIYVPKLVERCREFEESLVFDALLAEAKGVIASHQAKWHSLGVAESIHLPEQRPEAK